MEGLLELASLTATAWPPWHLRPTASRGPRWRSRLFRRR